MVIGGLTKRRMKNSAYALKVFKIFLNKYLLVYVIGSIGQVNQKISHLELGLKRYDSSEGVSKEILSAFYTRNPTVFFCCCF